MNVVTEMEYRSYVDSRKKAEKSYNELRELYGPDITNAQMFARALLRDKVITKDERDFLGRFYGIYS